MPILNRIWLATYYVILKEAVCNFRLLVNSKFIFHCKKVHSYIFNKEFDKLDSHGHRKI